MARQSRWQQFAGNFSAVYGSMNEAFKNIQSTRAMDDEYTDDNGNALTGDALDRARYEALANIYTRYGDAAGGLALRSNQAALQATNFENDVNTELRPELIRQRGVLQSGLMSSQINSNNASASNSSSAARERDAMLAGRLRAQELTNAGLGLSNDAAQLGLDLGRATFDSSVSEARARADNAAANASLTGVSASVAGRTADSTIAATNSGNNLTVAQNAAEQSAIADAGAAREAIAAAYSETLNQDFETPEEATTFFTNSVSNNPNIPPEMASAAISTVNNLGIERLTVEATRIGSELQRRARSGGLDAVADFYDSVNDGVDGRVIREGDTVRVVVSRNGRTETIAQASGENAEQVVLAQTMAIAANPATALEIAATNLEFEETQASIDQTKAQTTDTWANVGLRGSQVDLNRAQADLVSANVATVQHELEQARSGPSPSQRKTMDIIERGRIDLINSLAANQATEEEISAAVRLYDESVNTPPDGITAAEWAAMSFEDRALFGR